VTAQVVDLARVRAGLARLDAAVAGLGPNGRDRLTRFAADLAEDGDGALPYRNVHNEVTMPPSVTLTLRTAPEVVTGLEELVEALAGTPYAAVGTLTRSKVADLAIRRGADALRAELSGAPSPPVGAPGLTADLAGALPSPEVLRAAGVALEALARLNVDGLAAFATAEPPAEDPPELDTPSGPPPPDAAGEAEGAATSKPSRPRLKGEKRTGEADRRETQRDGPGRRNCDRVRTLRKALGLGQKEAAAEAGMTQAPWSRFEIGRTGAMNSEIRAWYDRHKGEVPDAEDLDPEPVKVPADDLPAGSWAVWKSLNRTAHLLVDPTAGSFACGNGVAPNATVWPCPDGHPKCKSCQKAETAGEPS